MFKPNQLILHMLKIFLYIKHIVRNLGFDDSSDEGCICFQSGEQLWD